MKFAALKTTALTAAALIAGSLAYAAAPGAQSDFESLYRPAPVAASLQNIATYAGEFSGRSDHVTRGTATIERTGTGYALVLSDDFYLDGAPDPVIAFGNGETYEPANKVSKLRKKRGAQRYALPAHYTPANFAEVYVWCEKFSVPLGVATVN